MTNPTLPLFDAATPADPLAASTIPVRANERRIYDLIAGHHGHKNPVSIEVLHRITNLSERATKLAVAELIVTHGVLIGASRQEPVGYFMIESDEDREVGSGPLRGQIIQMLRRLRVINGKAQVREWLGQTVLTEMFAAIEEARPEELRSR